ncbi:MAG: hypothetical protein COV66_02310 [Nitrospinae bacterium CG11_big_fil_rev_8_21_14_0_20_45_15]|nr:MAG: hypothetical protein COV66_02310 [Nitrospinae bacterium CG11_big_fil_rev_8_21_14_0_20_45_15]
MLVYANHITCSGIDAEDAVFKAIGGWIKEQLGVGLHPNQLKVDGTFDGKRDSRPSRLKIIATTEEKPELYAWILTNTDSSVSGRQWITELGLKISQNNILELTCIVKTDELSTKVTERVTASCPRVIQYILKNIIEAKNAKFGDSIIGFDLKTVGQDQDSYHSFLAEIKRLDRDRPIVVVSPDRDGNYLIDYNRLKDVLFGLAQVVIVSPEFSSHEMESVLGQQLSAWNGAVNIIHIPSATGFVYSRFFLSDEIEEWGDSPYSRISNLLSWVTDNTNARLQRKRIRSEGVMQLAVHRRLQNVQARSGQMDATQLREELAQSFQKIRDSEEYFNELVNENTQSENAIVALTDQLQDASEKIDKRKYEIQSLKVQLNAKDTDQTSIFDMNELFKIACSNYSPLPEACLSIISKLYEDKCIVLDSAINSARDMSRFGEGRRLLGMLKKLVNEYRNQFVLGGDNKARNVFGKNEYAAKESETVEKNKELRNARTFIYNKKPVEMFRHLKIGAGDDINKTIRVHFYWDPIKELIVIGYCGKHLPILNH